MFGRAIEVPVRALEVTERAIEVPVRALEVTERAIEVTGRALEVPVRAIEVTGRVFGCTGRAPGALAEKNDAKVRPDAVSGTETDVTGGDPGATERLPGHFRRRMRAPVETSRASGEASSRQGESGRLHGSGEGSPVAVPVAPPPAPVAPLAGRTAPGAAGEGSVVCGFRGERVTVRAMIRRAAPSRLLVREREDLDLVAESLHEGWRIVAFVVCAPELREEVVAYLSRASGRVLPPPFEPSGSHAMLTLLAEAAVAAKGEIWSVAIDPGVEETLRALNWNREKLRRGASMLVWIPDVAGLRAVRHLAQDAFSFRDILVVIQGEQVERIVPGKVDRTIDVRLAPTAREAEGSRLERALCWRAQGEVAARAGRLDDAERLLAEASSLWGGALAWKEDGNLLLARQRWLVGEIPAAQRLLAQVVATGGALSVRHAQQDLQAIAVESGAVHDGLAGLRAALHEAATARRDGALYRTAFVFTGCVVDVHGAGRLSFEDHAGAVTALREAQEVAVSISGDDPPWYHVLYPILRGRVLALVSEHVPEAIDITRAALDLCERSYTDAAPMAARTLATHLVKAGRFEEALCVVARATPQLVQERFLEELARARALKIACLVRRSAPASEIDATLTGMRATFDEMDAPRIAADTLLELALLLPPDSPSPDTLSLLEEAHEMFADMRIVAREARCLEAIGDVLSARGNPEDSRRRHLTAKAILERRGLLLRVPLLERKIAGTLAAP